MSTAKNIQAEILFQTERDSPSLFEKPKIAQGRDPVLYTLLMEEASLKLDFFLSGLYYSRTIVKLLTHVLYLYICGIYQESKQF